MTINVGELLQVTPHYEMRKRPSLDVDVTVEEHHLEHLFYSIWEIVGDDVLTKWLRSEGYSLQH